MVGIDAVGTATTAKTPKNRMDQMYKYGERTLRAKLQFTIYKQSTTMHLPDSTKVSVLTLLRSMLTRKNRAFVLERIQKFTFEDRPPPTLQDPHDVLVRVKYTGICGSDVSLQPSIQQLNL